MSTQPAYDARQRRAIASPDPDPSVWPTQHARLRLADPPRIHKRPTSHHDDTDRFDKRPHSLNDGLSSPSCSIGDDLDNYILEQEEDRRQSRRQQEPHDSVDPVEWFNGLQLPATQDENNHQATETQGDDAVHHPTRDTKANSTERRSGNGILRALSMRAIAPTMPIPRVRT